MDTRQRDIFIACSVGDLDWLERSITGCEMSIGKMVNHEVSNRVLCVMRSLLFLCNYKGIDSIACCCKIWPCCCTPVPTGQLS